MLQLQEDAAQSRQQCSLTHTLGETWHGLVLLLSISAELRPHPFIPLWCSCVDCVNIHKPAHRDALAAMERARKRRTLFASFSLHARKKHLQAGSQSFYLSEKHYLDC